MERLSSYDFYIEARRANDPASHHERVGDDTMALAVDDTVFSALCAGRLAPDCLPARAAIEPVWDNEGVTPYVTGLSVTIFWNAGEREVSYTRRFDKSPFHPRAKRLVAALIRKELKDDGAADEKYLWMVIALRKSGASAETVRKFSAHAVDSSFPIQSRPLEEFHLAWPEAQEESFAVFVSSGVVREIQERTLATEGRAEQAGVLIGHLGREVESGRVYAVVTAHVEAEVNVEAEMDSFKFTAETFMEIHRRIQLRQSGEIVLGWQHSHHYCAGCPSNPSGTTIFFSDADVTVQSAAFRSPYMVALVSGRDLDLEPHRPAVRMFGWSSADIKPRDFIQYTNEKEVFGNVETRVPVVDPAL